MLEHISSTFDELIIIVKIFIDQVANVCYVLYCDVAYVHYDPSHPFFIFYLHLSQADIQTDIWTNTIPFIYIFIFLKLEHP